MIKYLLVFLLLATPSYAEVTSTIHHQKQTKEFYTHLNKHAPRWKQFNRDSGFAHYLATTIRDGKPLSQLIVDRFNQHDAIGVAAIFNEYASGAEPIFTVVDGDTLIFNGEEVNIRGIDAPELDQPYGEDAKIAVEILIGSIQWEAKKMTNLGPNGRFATFVAPNGSSMAEALAAIGLAWSTDPKNIMQTKMQKLMAKAKRDKKNLWSKKNPVNPAMWRKYPARYKVDLSYLAENRYRAEQLRLANNAQQLAAWNNLVATNPELAQQIIAEREQKKRDKKILRDLRSIRTSQDYVRSQLWQIRFSPY